MVHNNLDTFPTTTHSVQDMDMGHVMTMSEAELADLLAVMDEVEIAELNTRLMQHNADEGGLS